MDTKKLLGLLAMKKILYSYCDADLAKVIGVSPKTFSRRMNDPETFTLGEIKHLIKFLNFSKEEKEEAFI